jgi:hypothetical protein
MATPAPPTGTISGNIHDRITGTVTGTLGDAEPFTTPDGLVDATLNLSTVTLSFDMPVTAR